MKFIYLHGFASGPTSGKAQYFRRKFEDRGFPLLIPQLDGGDFENLTLTSQLEIITRSAEGEPVALMGSSMGGYLAALYASRHPETTRLVLLAPAFYFPLRWAQTLGPDQTADWLRTGKMEVLHYVDGSRRQVSYRLIEDAAQYPSAPDFNQPAIVFHGTGDEVVPPSYSEEFAAAHPNVALRLLPSDHSLADQTGRIWEEAGPFLLGG